MHERKYDDREPASVTKVTDESFDAVAEGGYGNEFVSWSVEENDEEPEHEPYHTSQNLIEANQADTERAHEFSWTNVGKI
jgi:hypothetical protein